MKTELTIQVRSFPVRIKGRLTGDEREDRIVLDKAQLQAAQLVGQSARELIARRYDRAGFDVLHIGAVEKREIRLNLEELFKLHSVHQAGKGVGA